MKFGLVFLFPLVSWKPQQHAWARGERGPLLCFKAHALRADTGHILLVGICGQLKRYTV